MKEEIVVEEQGREEDKFLACFRVAGGRCGFSFLILSLFFLRSIRRRRGTEIRDGQKYGDPMQKKEELEGIAKGGPRCHNDGDTIFRVKSNKRLTEEGREKRSPRDTRAVDEESE